MGANRPVRQYEFDLYREGTNHRLTELEQWRRSHEQTHDEDDDEAEDNRRWSWQQIAAWAGVAAVLVAAAMGNVGK